MIRGLRNGDYACGRRSPALEELRGPAEGLRSGGSRRAGSQGGGARDGLAGGEPWADAEIEGARRNAGIGQIFGMSRLRPADIAYARIDAITTARTTSPRAARVKLAQEVFQ